jgi:hypothetical protein
MLKVATPVVRTIAVAALASGLAFAAPLRAAPADTSEPHVTDLSQPPAFQATPDQPRSPAPVVRISDSQAMRMHVENRIKTLHAKLGITDAQEPKWNDLAQVMRDNETNISQLIQERHRDPASMTAVDDLQSYEKIAQAHVDGLQRLIPTFASLYNDMSDEQQKKADLVFSGFEGHRPNMAANTHR